MASKAPSTLLMPLVATKSNVLQPLDSGNSRNQNLLKLNVTSARADSTNSSNSENLRNGNGNIPTGNSQGAKGAPGAKKGPSKQKSKAKKAKEQEPLLGPLQVLYKPPFSHSFLEMLFSKKL